MKRISHKHIKQTIFQAVLDFVELKIKDNNPRFLIFFQFLIFYDVEKLKNFTEGQLK